MDEQPSELPNHLNFKDKFEWQVATNCAHEVIIHAEMLLRMGVVTEEGFLAAGLCKQRRRSNK